MMSTPKLPHTTSADKSTKYPTRHATHELIGVHEIRLPHLAVQDPPGGSTLCLHGTMAANIPSILATGFRASKANESVYAATVCVTPDMAEAKLYQSYIQQMIAIVARSRDM